MPKLQKSDNDLLTNIENYDISVAKAEYHTVSDIFKADDEARIVYGWGNKITKDGEVVYDLQGDSISPQELVTATTEFMKSADRHSLNMHQGEPVGKVVHSFPLTYDIAKALGLETKDEGWLVGVHVTDDKTWEMVKAGDLAAFSIGGSALRKEIKE